MRIKKYFEAVNSIIEAMNQAVAENDIKVVNVYQHVLDCLGEHITCSVDKEGRKVYRRIGFREDSLHSRLLEAWVEACKTGFARIDGTYDDIANGREIIAACDANNETDQHVIENLDVNTLYFWPEDAGGLLELSSLRCFGDLCSIYRNELDEEAKEVKAELDDMDL